MNYFIEIDAVTPHGEHVAVSAGFDELEVERNKRPESMLNLVVYRIGEAIAEMSLHPTARITRIRGPYKYGPPDKEIRGHQRPIPSAEPAQPNEPVKPLLPVGHLPAAK